MRSHRSIFTVLIASESTISRPIAKLLVIISLFTMVGCAATSQQTVLMHPHYEVAGGLTVSINVDPTDPGRAGEIDLLSKQLALQIEATGVFDQVLAAGEQGGVGNLRLSCEIREIYRVSRGERAMLGALAGVARVEVHATIHDVASGELRGEGDFVGKSSGGTIFAGTTEPAIQPVAEAIASFMASGG